mgnify:CR=1 FL=1|jgi:hypothetical protein
MKTLNKLLIVTLLLISSCSKEEPEFCKDCKVNEIAENYVELSNGWISYSTILEKYIIRTPSYDISYDYCPYEFPEYFTLIENVSIKFKGYKTESPVFKSKFSEITCIRLDTIYYYKE